MKVNDFQGIIPVEFKALILVDKPDDKSSGGIYIPEYTKERQEYQADRGVLKAFNEGFWSNLLDPKPQIGDRVIFNSYAGVILNVKIDGARRIVRAINDKDIIAIDRSKKGEENAG